MANNDQDTPQPPDQSDEERIRIAKQAVDKDYLVLGRELYVSFSSGSFRDGSTTGSFDDYASRLGVEPGRARRLRRVFKKFSKDVGVSFERMLSIGYERLKAIEPIIDRSNKETWLNRATSLDYSDLVAEVKKHRKQTKRRRVVNPLSSSPQTVYKPENAADLIKTITDDRLKPSSDGQTVTSDEVVYLRTLFLIGDQNNVFNAAIDHMERRTGSTKLSYLLTSALQEFLAIEATRGTNDDGRMKYYMNILERRYKGQLLWVKDKRVAEKLSELIKKAEKGKDGDADQERPNGRAKNANSSLHTVSLLISEGKAPNRRRRV